MVQEAEGPTFYSNTPKWAQSAYLCTSYETTHALKWSGREILAKNSFPIFPDMKVDFAEVGIEKIMWSNFSELIVLYLARCRYDALVDLENLEYGTQVPTIPSDIGPWKRLKNPC